jgi:hypothetical protein
MFFWLICDSTCKAISNFLANYPTCECFGDALTPTVIKGSFAGVEYTLELLQHLRGGGLNHV